MGTEIAISFSTLRAQLESEKSSLFKIDENIKKIVQTTGRFNNDRFNATGDYSRGAPRLGGRNSYPDASSNYKHEEQFNKRKHETKTVFSRLSARVNDSDGEEDGPGAKRARMPSAVSRELPTRAAVLRAQGDDEQARTRNRRIFGSLLGTLQKFKQEEIGLQTKEDKKAQVERKIEEQARMEKEREQKERKTLFAEREQKKTTIKALEAKMGRVQEFEKWEASQKSLGNFILTKAKPHIYWIPKRMTEKAAEKLDSSKKFHEKYLARKRVELQEELQRIEQRCLCMRGAGGPGREEQENKHDASLDVSLDADDKGKRRDKFAMDAEDKDGEESDGEIHEGDKRNGDANEQIEESNIDKPSEDAPMETDEVSEAKEPAVEDETLPKTDNEKLETDEQLQTDEQLETNAQLDTDKQHETPNNSTEDS